MSEEGDDLQNIKFKERKVYYDIDTTIEQPWKEMMDRKVRLLLIGPLYQPISKKSSFA